MTLHLSKDELVLKPKYPRIWRWGSRLVMSGTGLLFKAFFAATQKSPSIHGLESFTALLRARKKHTKRGLVTISNHKSVLDDPSIWSLLPFQLQCNPTHLRYGLGAQDILFKNIIFKYYFLLGQTLPTYRFGAGPYQPALDRAVELLNQGAWVHIFPEARVHQLPNHEMRYFKWGVARLLLEPERHPAVVPIFFTGMEEIMDEDRRFPRLLPRLWKKVQLRFGECVESGWTDLRKEWAALRKGHSDMPMSQLAETPEGRNLRVSATARARNLVVGLRRQMSLPEENANAALVETYKTPDRQREGRQTGGASEKDSLI